MPKSDSAIVFLAGIGVGVVAAVILAPDGGRGTRRRIREVASRTADAIRGHAGALGGAAGELIEAGELAWRNEKHKGSENMSNLKDKAKDKIDDAADTAKKVAGKVVDKSKDVVHSAGKKLEEGGKRLQDA